MKIIDRTIVWNFMVNLILWCLALCGIIMVSDLLTHFDDFFNSNAEISPLMSIGRYYGFFYARIADSFLTFIIVISALNILINMFRRNEVIALMSIGVSPTRILIPLLAASLCLSVATFYLRENFVPRHIVSVTGPHEYFTMKTENVPVKPVQDEWTKVTVEGESVSVDGKWINRPIFRLPSARFSDGLEIRALRATHCSKSVDRPEGYLLTGVENSGGFLEKGSIDLNGIVRGAKINSSDVIEGEEEEKFLFDEKNILVYTPADYKDILTDDECYVVCGIPPEFLAVGQEWKSYTSTAKLIDAAKNASLPFKTDDLLLRIHTRILKPFSDLFPLLLALPILFVYKDGNPYKRGAFAALIAGLYIGSGYATLFIFPDTVAPVLKVCLPMILFFPVVVALFSELKNC